MKNNKITAEEQDMDNVGKLCSERKTLWKKKLLATLSYVYHESDTNMHCIIFITYVGVTGIEISMILPLQHRFKLLLILSSVAKYLSQVLQENNFKDLSNYTFKKDFLAENI